MSKLEKWTVIHSLDELMKQEQVMVFLGDVGKIYHKAWIQSWQIRYAWMLVKAGRCFKVKERTEK